MSKTVFLNALGIASGLGQGKAATAQALFAGLRPQPFGRIPGELPPLPAALSAWECRNNRLLLALLNEMEAEIAAAIGHYGPKRVAVVIGTSTSGIAEGEVAVDCYHRTGALSADYAYTRQETGSGAEFIARHLGISGPAWVVATACSSAAKAMASARRLLRQGMADAVITGGADTLCRLTQAGFSALESVAADLCNPMSRNRDGITIGEGGALFLMTRDPGDVALLGVGESSDAHHISAPDPSGAGALDSMRRALADAGLEPGGIAYVNLHGTATPLNDAMESKAVAELLGLSVACSSTKALTGHTLGAAGAVEAAFVWLTLSRYFNPARVVPPHLWDGVADPDLAPLALAAPGTPLPPGAGLSNSFAFGGSNCTLVLR
ncbi:Beta-ketoacyl synthase [Candidatus Terasakiella magnetica]|nr:Beta-ketoacyl synthase [Candidatus Terasakiella magnetica]